MLSSSDALPSPLVLGPTGDWDGNDGNWSTFSLSIGTPAQSFRILPRTVGEGIWIPVYGSCAGPLENVSDCGNMRGADSFNGAASVGFLFNESSTWDQLGPYQLDPYQSLFSAQGLFGLDTVTLNNSNSSGGQTVLDNQLVAGIVTEDLWLGSLGMGWTNSSFPGAPLEQSFLVSMKTQHVTPSLSYSYTAGKSYADDPGSLILGGYEPGRLSPSLLTSSISTDQMLEVTLQSIVATNTRSAPAQGLLSDAIPANIDSSISQLWLPAQTCDYFAEAFGLTYDSTTGLYLVDETTRGELLANQTEITFTLTSPSGRANVVLSYHSFDLTVGVPFYNVSTPYFPIRRATNDTQFTLGRTFLQEAYIVVDWERGNFTVGQVQKNTSNVVRIDPLRQNSGLSAPSGTVREDPKQGGLRGPPTAEIVGIVVSTLMFCVLCGTTFCFCRRLRRSMPAKETVVPITTSHSAEQANSETVPPLENVSEKDLSRREATVIHELEASQIQTELMSTPVVELETPVLELDHCAVVAELNEAGGSASGDESQTGRFDDDLAKL